MEEGGFWRPSCSTLSLEQHGSSTHLCARHAPPRLHRHPHAHAHHTLAHQHAHQHTHHLPHAQHASCPVHSPFRQPTPEYCAAHSQGRWDAITCHLAMISLCALICLAIGLGNSAFIPASFFHNYLKDGRVEDGPFPSSLTNVPYYCYQVPLKGPCSGVYMVWFFDIVRRQCMPMFYSGCGGNENRFTSKASCQLHCDHSRRI